MKKEPKLRPATPSPTRVKRSGELLTLSGSARDSAQSERKRASQVSVRVLKLLEEKELACDQIQQMHEAGVPQKCLFHEVYFSSFCRDCREIVCVNCVYGNTPHKSHRVVPIKNAESDIQLANENLLNRVRKSLNSFCEAEAACEQNHKVLQENLNLSLQDLKRTFDSIVLAVREKQVELEKQIVKAYTLAKEFHEALSDNVREILVFMNRQLSKIGSRVLPDESIYLNRLYGVLTKDVPSDVTAPQELRLGKPVLSEVVVKQVIARLKALELAEHIGIAHSPARSKSKFISRFTLGESY
jgi:hypothetical protein